MNNYLRPIQLSNRDVLDSRAQGRRQLATAQWKDFLLRSVGLELGSLGERAKNAFLLRMVPFVERNYNMVELGPRGTGKSHLYQQISPYAHLISGGKATVAKMFVDNGSGRRGLVCQYDVICFDEVSGISFDSKDGVNIMKGYIEAGEFSRGKESIRADGSMVFVGNFDVDVEHQQRVGHLFGPLPQEMRDDTAFMDRIHCYLPGWDVPKVNAVLLTEHFGLVSDFLSECFSRLRSQSRVNVLQNRVQYGGSLSGRDTNAVNKTVSGLLKLLYPDPDDTILDEDLEWAVRLALESVDDNAGLYRIEVNEGPGSNIKILNKPVPQAFQESVRFAQQNLYSHAVQLVGDRDPRGHEFSLQLRSFDASKKGAKLGIPALIAMCSALLKKSVRGGLIVVGELNLGGSIEPIYNAVNIVELAVEKGAQVVLMPVSCRRQLIDLSDDMATKVDVQFYADARDVLLKALVE